MHKVKDCNEAATLGHIKVQMDKEALALADNRLNGHSCIDCGFSRMNKFTLVCSKDIFTMKFVRSYNICHAWKSIPNLNTDEDS